MICPLTYSHMTCSDDVRKRATFKVVAFDSLLPFLCPLTNRPILTSDP